MLSTLVSLDHMDGIFVYPAEALYADAWNRSARLEALLNCSLQSLTPRAHIPEDL
jgi:hypothetical protein